MINDIEQIFNTQKECENDLWKLCDDFETNLKTM